jgi:malate synthase
MTSEHEAGTTALEAVPGGRVIQWRQIGSGVEINEAAWTHQAERIFTPAAIRLIAKLHRELQDERLSLLAARVGRQEEWDAGAVPGYLDDEISTAAKGDWQIAPLADDLMRRRVEITGPINDTKMVINMLSRTDSGDRADAAMLDFEDSMKPAWGNVMQGVENLIGAADGSLSFVKPAQGDQPQKTYKLDPQDMPLLMARCRGLHLTESNVRVDDHPVSGGLMDLALSTLHTADKLLSQGKTPKYYVPKVEHYLEARWWNTLFCRLEDELGLERSSLRATFLMETLSAAFQMEEILYELREHATGLNVGRWDKIFSDIKTLKGHADKIMADRASISLNRPWMKNYAERLIKICHRHGAFAMGGMAAFTPGKTPERRQEQTAKVVEDKEFEFRLGHDGCWVSHPYFIKPAMSAFTRENQLDITPDIDDQPDLIPEMTPPRTLDGLRTNIRVGIAYMKGWQQDIGCVAWDDLMEDLATLEISRAQTWQWLHHGVALDDGGTVTEDLVVRIFREEMAKIANEIREAMTGFPDEAIAAETQGFQEAQHTACAIFTEPEFRPFLKMSSDLVTG